MTTKRMTFEEFRESYYDENSELCSCNATPTPPCPFCEGYYVQDAYNDYLEEFEEEK